MTPQTTLERASNIMKELRPDAMTACLPLYRPLPQPFTPWTIQRFQHRLDTTFGMGSLPLPMTYHNGNAARAIVA